MPLKLWTIWSNTVGFMSKLEGQIRGLKNDIHPFDTVSRSGTNYERFIFEN